MKPKSLGSMIGQFKSCCTKRIWSSGFGDFAWQGGFYDHIIRSEESLNKIRQYILDNPGKWQWESDHVTNMWI
ncbi:MAG: hypothetical protein HY675_18515 [Chloroflexi bacterium]|nr:hypothetical protein [Chloroflexota bacterium]